MPTPLRMRFLIDTQLPPALARLVKGAGHECEHVIEVGLREADDAPMWTYAVSCGATIITKDEDFANRKAARPGRPGVVWIRVGNCSNRALLDWFAPLLPSIVDRLERGEGLIESV